MVGIPVLAQKLVEIQANIISKCLPDICKKINEKLSTSIDGLDKLPKHVSSPAEEISIFMNILSSGKESLKKILVQGEFDEYPDEVDMHCTAIMKEMLEKCRGQLESNGNPDYGKRNDFLLDEIRVLEQSKSIGLPNFLPRAAFLTLLHKKVKTISQIPIDFVDNVWNCIEKAVVSVLMKRAENYPQLFSAIGRAAHNLMAKKKQKYLDWVNELVEMEKTTDYTCNPEYNAFWSKLMANQESFLKCLNNLVPTWSVGIEGFGDIDIGHLRSHMGIVKEAFDLKMRITAYWKIVLMRVVDIIGSRLRYVVKNLVNEELERGIINEVMDAQSNRLKRMFEESPAVAEKRKRLKSSIQLLKESKVVVESIMDGVVPDFA